MLTRKELQKLRETALYKTHWDYMGFKTANGLYYGTQNDWNNTLITKINMLSARLDQTKLEGPAHSVYVSPLVFDILSSTEYFEPNVDSEKRGKIGNRYEMFIDENSPIDSVLVLNDTIHGVITVDNLLGVI